MTTENDESLLKSAAKAIGGVAGKVASMVGGAAAAAPASPKKVKIAKLPPKNKARLPRKEKKIEKKRAEAANKA